MVIREASGSPQDAFEPLGLTLNLTFAGSSHRLSLCTEKVLHPIRLPLTSLTKKIHHVPCWGQSGRGQAILLVAAVEAAALNLEG